MMKRKSNATGPDGAAQPAKRLRNNDISLSNRSSPSKTRNSASSFTEQPRQDPTYGQRGAFPGLDNDLSLKAKLGTGHDDQDEIGVAAMAYLREVR